MAKTSEPAIGIAVMQVLADEPRQTASVKTLVNRVPEFIELTDEDLEPSLTRENEAVWEQRVRNLKSHDKTEGNVFAEGFVEYVAKGTYRLTEAGRLHLEHKGLI